MAKNAKIIISGFYWFCKKKLVKMMQLYVAPKRTFMDVDLYTEKIDKDYKSREQVLFSKWKSMKEIGVLKPEII